MVLAIKTRFNTRAHTHAQNPVEERRTEEERGRNEEEGSNEVTVLLVRHDTSLTNTKIRGFYFYVHIMCVKYESGGRSGSGVGVQVWQCVTRLGPSLLLAGWC